MTRTDANGIVWRVDLALDDSKAHIVGEHDECGSCLWSVDQSGNYWIEVEDTDGDFDGDGWPTPPDELIEEARQLAG